MWWAVYLWVGHVCVLARLSRVGLLPLALFVLSLLLPLCRALLLPAFPRHLPPVPLVASIRL